MEEMGRRGDGEMGRAKMLNDTFKSVMFFLETTDSPSPRLPVSPSSRLPFLIFVTLAFIFLLTTQDARAVVNSARVPLPSSATTVSKVGPVGMTVSDMDRSIEFYSKILSFEKVSDIEVTGDDYERLQGVFGLRMRVVRMRLGDEFIELTEYLAPKGRPIPV